MDGSCAARDSRCWKVPANCLAAGYPADSVMRHVGSEVEALRSTVGTAAKLSVADRDRGKPTFELWRTMPPSSAVTPPIEFNPEQVPEQPDERNFRARKRRSAA